MQCKEPVTIRKTHHSGSRETMAVPCGRCVFCLARRRNDWSLRLQAELRHAQFASFVTLTYDDEHLPRTPKEYPDMWLPTGTLSKRDLQLFLKKLRKFQETKVPEYHSDNKSPQIRYFIVGEYSDKDRPHYHALLFNVHTLTEGHISAIWGNGFVHVGKVQEGSIHYTTKYMLKNVNERIKESEEKDRTAEFALMSRRPGIGNSYITQSKTYHRKSGKSQVRNDSGQLSPMPRYYREKIWNPLERKIQNQRGLDPSETKYAEETTQLEKKGENPDNYRKRSEELKENRLIKIKNQKRTKL